MRSVTFFVAVALASAANAAVVYDNGGPNGVTGYNVTSRLQAEDFTLDTTTTLATAGIYLAESNGPTNWDGNLNWWIFDSSDGPGAVLASGSATPTAVDTGIGTAGLGNAYLVEFSLNNFTATAGTTYWLGIHAQDNDDWTVGSVFWVSTDANGTASHHESKQGTRDNWSPLRYETAFYLTGSEMVPGVPEPAAWALLIAGFGLVGTSLRHRRTLAEGKA